MCAASGIPFVKEEIKSSILIRITGDQREEEEGDGCPEKQFSVLMQTNSSLRPRTIIS